VVVCFHYQVRLLNDKGTERRAALLEMRMDALQKDSDEFFTLCLQDTSDGLEQAVSLPRHPHLLSLDVPQSLAATTNSQLNSRLGQCCGPLGVWLSLHRENDCKERTLLLAAWRMRHTLRNVRQ